VLPAIEEVTARFGVPPRIVRLLPEGQELDPRDFYPLSVLHRVLQAARPGTATAV